MFRYDRPVLFLKATIKKQITVPGYYRHDGTYVPPHQKTVNIDPDKEMHHVISGQGTHSQKEAHKKLSKLPGWSEMDPEHQHAHILSAAQNIQTKATKAAQVSVWKKDMLAGQTPKAANIAAFEEFMSNDPEKAGAMLAAISEKIGWQPLQKLILAGAIGKEKQKQAAPEPKFKYPPEAEPVTLEKPAPHFGEQNVGKVFSNTDGVLFKFDGEKWLKKWDAEADWLNVNKQENVDKLNAGKDFLGQPLTQAAEPAPPAAPSVTDEQAKIAAEKVTELVGGKGGHYPVLAAKKLTGDAKWQSGLPVEQLQMIVDLAKQMQAEATASAAVSGFKKSVKEGKVPSKAQTHAFFALPEAKQLDISQKLIKEGAHPGDVASLKHQALVKHGFPVKDEPKVEPAPPAPAPAPAPKPEAAPVAAQPVEASADVIEDVLHNTSPGHNKFWSVAVSKKPNAKGKFVVTKKWGKIGTTGQSKEWHYGNLNAALNAASDWKAKKKANGYYEVDSPTAAAAKDGDTKFEGGDQFIHLNGEWKKVEVLKKVAPEKSGGEVAANGWDFSMSDPGLSGAPSFTKDDWYVAYSPEDGGTWEVGKVDPDSGEPDTAQYSDVESLAGHFELFGLRGPSKAALAAMADADSLAQKLIGNVSPPDDGPKDGDTKPAADGGTLVFKDGHWHKQDEGPTPEKVKAALDAVPLPDLPNWPSASAVIEKLKQSVAKEGHDAFKAVKKLVTKAKYGGHQKMHLTFKGYNNWGGDKKYNGYITPSADGNGFEGTTQNGTNALALYAYVEALKSAHEAVAGKPKKGAQKAAKLIVPATKQDAVALSTASSSKKVDGLPVAVMDKWQQTGGQQGSNPGGTYKDGAGQEWYVKFPKSLDHAKNELLASKLYSAAGVAVPKLRLVEKDGKIGIASKMVAGVSKVGPGMKDVEGSHEGFAVDAWLGNYDSVGTGYDNLLKTPEGKAIRIDVGGSLLFRAQGAPKTNFGDEVKEIDTMRDAGVNSYAAAVFGNIGKEQLNDSVALVLEIPDDVIEQVVSKFGPGSEAEKKALAAKLIARKNDLAKKFPEAEAIANPPKPDPRKLPVDASKLPTKLDFLNWKGAGKGLSSVDAVNKSNQQAVDAIYESAMKGDFVALKKLQFDQVNKQTGEVEKKVSFGEHPSQHVKDFYSTVLDYMEVIANPAAKKMKVWDIGDYSDIDELSDAFKAHFYGVSVGDVPANQRLGFWISLGQADAAGEFIPKKVDYISAANREKGKKSNIGIPDNLRSWMKAVKASGSANQPYRDGKEVDYQGNKTRDVLAAAYKHAVELEEGTLFTKDINMPNAMLQQMIALEPGHVFQNPGSMCASFKKDWHWGGDAKLKIIAAKGAKGIYNIGVGSHDGEDEITTIPGARFMLLETKDNKKMGGGKEFTLLMLPPDETYVANIHPKG